MAAGALWQDDGLIFASEVGTPMDPDNFSHSFARLCERAGLGPARAALAAAAPVGVARHRRISSRSVRTVSNLPGPVISALLGSRSQRSTSACSCFRHGKHKP